MQVKAFGRLTILRRISWGGFGKPGKYLCGCYCGNYTEVSEHEINRTKNKTTSCGKCYDKIKYRSEYNIWVSMYQRCYNPNDSEYHNYGGRGISICQRWRQDFLFFLEDVGLRPSCIHSIDRKDNNGNYEPTNVRWATPKEQANNRQR